MQPGGPRRNELPSMEQESVKESNFNEEREDELAINCPAIV